MHSASSNVKSRAAPYACGGVKQLELAQGSRLGEKAAQVLSSSKQRGLCRITQCDQRHHLHAINVRVARMETV